MPGRRVGVCEQMQRMKISRKSYILPQSFQPGAPPAAKPKGYGHFNSPVFPPKTRLTSTKYKLEAEYTIAMTLPSGDQNAL